ncbi:MAG: hypothetical protein EBS05_19510 [Proteobacteria bacterium]|nr:hypothetical protein [Pseudomonadota bacterium]
MVELGASWKRWAKHRTDAELAEINQCLHALVEGFGKPHVHAGLGVRRLTEQLFEFRVSRELRVVFVLIKPGTLRLVMCGSHDDVRAWLKSNT